MSLNLNEVKEQIVNTFKKIINQGIIKKLHMNYILIKN